MSDLDYTVADGIGRITFDRPDQMNAMSRSMRERLVEVTGLIEADADVRAVLIRANGDHFMAGGNIKDFRSNLESDAAAHLAGAEQRALSVHLAILRLRRMAKPVVAAVHGAVAGMGVSLMLAADIVVAADDSYFTMAFTRIGLPGDCGITYHLPRLVGERKALELLLLGERVDAQEAARIGLVNRLVARDELEEASERFVRRLADGPTTGIGLTKHLVRQSFDTSLEEQLMAEATASAKAIGTADHLEGVRSFLERRKPRFVGR